MGFIPYTLSQDSIRNMRSQVLEWSTKPVNEAHLLQCTLDGATRLRVQQVPRTIALYFPENRKTLWQNLLPRIRTIASQSGYECIIVNDKPHSKSLSLFDNLVWAVSRCERIICDTSGKEGPDLLGSFALGFAFSLSRKRNWKQIRRLEEKGLKHQENLSMWPSQQYATWGTPEDLYSLIQDFLPQKKSKQP